ncbi:hypothetical protein IJ732_07375 [bacterium]|nr:hypothetical protein [bacterium]
MTMDLLDFEMLCGILTGVVAIIIAVVVNKTWKYVHLAKFKREFPNEKIEFVYSPTWKSTIFIPGLIGFVIGSSIFPMYIFSDITNNLFITQVNKHFILLIFGIYYLAWVQVLAHVFIFTKKQIVIRVPDKLNFFAKFWTSSRNIKYSEIVSYQKIEYKIVLKLSNGDIVNLHTNDMNKIYPKLQLLLDNYKEEN